MKVVNMKTGTESVEGDNGQTETRDEYPWGLRLSLDGDALKKLGITVPKVGDVLAIGGLVKVVGVSTNEAEGGESRSNVDFQITDLGMSTPDKDEAKSLQKAFYPGGDE